MIRKVMMNENNFQILKKDGNTNNKKTATTMAIKKPFYGHAGPSHSALKNRMTQD